MTPRAEPPGKVPLDGGPPRLLVRLLEAILPSTLRTQQILGDLHEEYVARASQGRRRATLWYLRESAGIAIRYARPTEGFMDALVRNVRYSLRRLGRSPLFTVVAVVSLGLGIGANTAMFSLVNSVVIREKPYEESHELVDVFQGSPDFSHGTLSYPDYLDFLDGTSDVFETVGGGQFTAIQADADEGVELLFAEAVTGNYFRLLGVEAHRGRLLSADDHVARGAHPVVVLSYGYWMRRFGGDPGVVGAELRLSGRPYVVIGVAPPEFTGSLRGLEPAVWVPIMMVDELQGFGGNVMEARGNQSFFGRGRLREGATVAQAEAAAERVAIRLREEYPEQWTAGEAFVLETTDDVVLNPMIDRFLMPAVALVMGVVGLVLLIACANLASFLLARAADRRKEIAVRLAMGASRRTLVAQLLTEAVLLAAVGGVVGVLTANYALDALVSADLPLALPITLDLSLDRTVLGFSLLVSLGAGVLFGLAPALQSTNPDLAPTLRDETAGGGRARGAFLRDALVAGQVAVSVMLLVGAGLFLRSLDASRNIDPGFGDGPTAILQMTVPADRYDDEEALAFIDDFIERVQAMPTVDRAGIIDNIPLNQLNTQNIRLRVDGVDPPPGQDFHLIDYARVDERFLGAASIEVVAGRGFEASDGADGEAVALVNQEVQRRFFPGGDALGRSIDLNGDPFRVVGVIADHKVRQLGEAPRPYVLLPLRQDFTPSVTVLARTSGDAERVALDMMLEARSMDPTLMIVDAKTLDRHLAVVLLGRELGALVVSGFALLALLLASIGVYGVVSYAVSRRVHEVGIRLSLGADAAGVARMLTAGGMRLALLGGGVGLLMAAGVARLLSRLLYGVPPLDPVTFIGVPLVLGVVALLASWIPARRVTRIDPVRALRSE